MATETPGQLTVDDVLAELAAEAVLARGPGWVRAELPTACVLCGMPVAPGEALRITSTPAGSRWAGECCGAVP